MRNKAPCRARRGRMPARRSADSGSRGRASPGQYRTARARLLETWRRRAQWLRKVRRQWRRRPRPFATRARAPPHGWLGPSGYRARRELNHDTIKEMHKAFIRAGAQAINRVMRNNPAMFLKLLVLLGPREMKVEPSGGIRKMRLLPIARALDLRRGGHSKR